MENHMATTTPFLGPWRIVWMSNWDQDFIDMEVPGHFTFDARRMGSFQFGLVQGEMDCRFEGKPPRRVEFTWEGNDECDEASGSGHAEIVGGELHGQIQFHGSDGSEFRAVRQEAPRPKTPRKRKPA